MDQLLHTLLTQILVHGYPIIVGIIALAYVGLPISLNAVLLAAGSFASDGSLNIFILVPLVAGASVLGDLLGYYLGKRYGFWIVDRVTSRVGLTHSRVSTVDRLLKKWGIVCVFLTRWLFTPLGIPVNLMAGISNYSFKRFLIWSSIGEVVWSSIYLSLGYIFGANWQTLADYIGDAPTVLTLMGIGIVFLILSIRLWRAAR